MRECWYDDVVDHDGERFHYEGLQVRPQPARLDVWLGGIAPSELRRVGRLADGWLPSFITPADAAAGRAVIEQVAAEHERAIEDDHYGVLIPYTLDAVPDVLARPARPAPSRPRRPVDARARRLGRADRHGQALRRRRHDEVRRPPGRRARRRDAWDAHLADRRRRPPPARDLTSQSRSRLGTTAQTSRPRAAIAALRPGMAGHAAAAAGAGAAQEDVGVRGLDAPPAHVGGPTRRTATAGRGGRCGRPASPRPASISQRPHRPRCSPGRAGSPRSARRARCRASAGSPPAPRPARRPGRRGTAGPACAGRTASASGRRPPRRSGPRIVGSVSEWQ